MSRFEVLEQYEERLRRNNTECDISGVRKKSTDHIRLVLQAMQEAELFEAMTYDHEVIWEIFASKQKSRYLVVMGIATPEVPGFVKEDITRCYMCRCLVARQKHDKFPPGKWDIDTRSGEPHHWNISHIISKNDSNCSDNFNLRICCRQCNVHTGTSTPALCSVRRELQGLAVRENIMSLEEAFYFYFQFYEGRRHGV